MLHYHEYHGNLSAMSLYLKCTDSMPIYSVVLPALYNEPLMPLMLQRIAPNPATETRRAARAGVAVFGNYAAPPDPAGVAFGGAIRYAIGFVTGTAPVPVCAVEATLSRSLDGAPEVRFGIYSDRAGDPHQLLFSFGARTITNTFGWSHPYLFAPSGAFVLRSETAYHLCADAVCGALALWYDAGGTSGTEPAVPVAQNESGIAFAGCRDSFTGGKSYRPCDALPHFRLLAPAAVTWSHGGRETTPKERTT